MSNICPACDVGTLRARVADRNFLYEGVRLTARNLHYSECDHCGEEVVLAPQSKLNEVKYADAKKEHLGLWSCGRIERFRTDWGMTQQIAAKIFGGGANAFSKYERGEVIHSRSMNLLMEEFEAHHEVRVSLSEKAGVKLQKVLLHKPEGRRSFVSDDFVGKQVHLATGAFVGGRDKSLIDPCQIYRFSQRRGSVSGLAEISWAGAEEGYGR